VSTARTEAGGMSARPRRQRRLLLPVSIALLLAVETTTATFAFAPRLAPALDTAVPRPSAVAVVESATEAGGGSPSPDGASARRIRLLEAARDAAPVVAAASPATPKPAAAKSATPKPSAPKAASTATARSSTRTFAGRNHVWIPSLGISRSVSWFPCSRSTPPGNLVYRWGCAGRNNVYLFGHAYSVMKPLHDAYVSGRLRKGMAAWYADASGRVRRYVVSYWRVVRPDGDIGWAYAAQSRPSLTLQTCVGANSQYRLVVRLVASG
jgi:hypothetical protein